MKEDLYIHKDNEQLTYDLICDLLSKTGLSFEAKDESMIQINGSNGVYVIFTDNLPWITISHPAKVRESRDIDVLKASIEQYDLIMVKCRLYSDGKGGTTIDVFLQSIEQTYGHFRDSLGTYIYLLDRAFTELGDLCDNLQTKINTDSKTISNRDLN